MQFPKVPLFGQGTNYIPMIHVYDLGGWLLILLYFYMQNLREKSGYQAELCSFCRVLQNILELKPKSKYILAIDDSNNTLEDIVMVTSWKIQIQQ